MEVICVTKEKVFLEGVLPVALALGVFLFFYPISHSLVAFVVVIETLSTDAAETVDAPALPAYSFLLHVINGLLPNFGALERAYRRKAVGFTAVIATKEENDIYHRLIPPSIVALVVNASRSLRSCL
jgi:hypothetical protein